jgi:heme-degrading monooxygenase HmoA
MKLDWTRTANISTGTAPSSSHVKLNREASERECGRSPKGWITEAQRDQTGGSELIVRIWRTGVDPDRALEYREFAQSRSLPMFRNQPGFRGVLFSAAGAVRIVITLWDDAEAAAALDASETYAETVAAIVATGFLRGESTVEVFDPEDFYVEQNFAGNES